MKVRSSYAGRHVGCGGRIYFRSTETDGWLECFKCKASQLKGDKIEETWRELNSIYRHIEFVKACLFAATIWVKGKVWR